MSQIYLEKCNLCFIPFIALKRNILENSDFVLLKEDIHRFISSIELFLRDIRGLRYADLKKVNFFAGHPVQERNNHPSPKTISPRNKRNVKTDIKSEKSEQNNGNNYI